MMNFDKLDSWDIYPRPGLVRNSFINLNGEWDFCEGNKTIPESFSERIAVPYPMESELSGINRGHKPNRTIWYKRSFIYKSEFENGRVILNCGGIDREAEVWINGVKQTESLSFLNDSIELTGVVDGENEIIIGVYDNLKDLSIPYGKQSRYPSGMWYTPVSGIWQTIWIENVPDKYVRKLKIIQDKNGVMIRTIGVDNGIITLENGDKYLIHGGKCRIKPKNLRKWSANDPYLYRFKLSAGQDMLTSYFAVRDLSIREIAGHNRMLVNGKPEYFHGLLDQGYFKEGIYTPKSPSKYLDDIRAAKKLGFNMLRKHIKVEPEIFYYLCDVYGMYVFQDMVNNGPYSFIRDTAIPTFGFQWLPDHHMNRNERQRKNFYAYSKKTVKRLYNHPSIVYWTIFNEGWGQFQSTKMYQTFKRWDKSRFVDSASGWFKCGETDISSWHVYFHKFLFPIATERPVILSEYGGYAFKIHGHSHDEKKLYGYANYRNSAEYNKALKTLFERDVISHIDDGLCGDVYTQLSDVETEENGLITYDREIIKPNIKLMQRIRRRIDSAMDSLTRN